MGAENAPGPRYYPQNYAICRDFKSGRCWVRTSDLLLVREALYP
jgi:hypothetical protein